MNERQFKTYLNAARLTVGGDYFAGYQRGLRRHYHGEAFGTEAEHDQWSRLGLDGDHRTDLGDGYRDGAEGKPPRGLHGNAGNEHAQIGEEAATAVLHIRCTREQKARWVNAAQRAGQKLSAWVIERLER